MEKKSTHIREIPCWSPYLAPDVCCSFHAVRLSRNRQPRAFRPARARRPKLNATFLSLERYWQIISSVTQWRIRCCLSLFSSPVVTWQMLTARITAHSLLVAQHSMRCLDFVPIRTCCLYCVTAYCRLCCLI